MWGVAGALPRGAAGEWAARDGRAGRTVPSWVPAQCLSRPPALPSQPAILPLATSNPTPCISIPERSNYVSYKAIAMSFFRLFFPHAAVFGSILKWLRLVPREPGQGYHWGTDPGLRRQRSLLGRLTACARLPGCPKSHTTLACYTPSASGLQAPRRSGTRRRLRRPSTAATRATSACCSSPFTWWSSATAVSADQLL